MSSLVFKSPDLSLVMTGQQHTKICHVAVQLALVTFIKENDTQVFWH